MLTSRTFDQKYYEEHREHGLDFLECGEWQLQYARWLSETLDWRRASVLDVGCASGNMVLALDKVCGFAMGIDVSEYAVTLGRARWAQLRNRILICDAVNLHPFIDQLFGGLHCSQVAEHWREEHVPLILRELHRVTKAHGYFFCQLDTQDLFERQKRDPGVEDPTNKCVRPQEWWIEQLEATGWQMQPDMAERLYAHEDSYLKKYDWDWFIARRLP